MTRRRVPFAILAVALLALVVAATYLLLTADTSSHYRYATYAEIQSDDSVHAATIPSFVPRSARELVGSYNVEFNTQTLEFAFDPSDRATLTSGFKQAAGHEIEAIERRLRSYNWENEFPSKSQLVAYTLVGSGATEYLVIDPKNARAYYALERN